MPATAFKYIRKRGTCLFHLLLASHQLAEKCLQCHSTQTNMQCMKQAVCHSHPSSATSTMIAHHGHVSLPPHIDGIQQPPCCTQHKTASKTASKTACKTESDLDLI
jgi:hypothetical protein